MTATIISREPFLLRMTEHFDRPGKGNTGRVVELALKRARELKIKEMVVATNTGWTVRQLLKKSRGMKITAVALHAGFDEPFKMDMTAKTRGELEGAGVRVISGPHALSGVERAISSKFGGLSPAEIAAHTLRMFGQGTKVCVEVTVMAADAGALSGKDVIALGGTSEGADTACVIKPAHAKDFFGTRILEIVCKPRRF